MNFQQNASRFWMAITWVAEICLYSSLLVSAVTMDIRVFIVTACIVGIMLAALDFRNSITAKLVAWLQNRRMKSDR